MNGYSCVNCGGQASKPPCKRFIDPKKPAEGSKATLGTWSCAKCGHGISVKRYKVEPKAAA